MSTLIAAIFSDEATAKEGVRVLTNLHTSGNISLSGMAVLVNDAATGLSLKHAVDERHRSRRSVPHHLRVVTRAMSSSVTGHFGGLGKH